MTWVPLRSRALRHRWLRCQLKTACFAVLVDCSGAIVGGAPYGLAIVRREHLHGAEGLQSFIERSGGAWSWLYDG